MSDEKPKKLPSLLKRDEHNKLVDPTEGYRKTQDLVRKLLTEERKHDKDMSFHAKGSKRDIVVMMGVYVRNTVDGKMVIGDNEQNGYESFGDHDPFKYKTYDTVVVEFPARNLPNGPEFIGKGLMQGFAIIRKYLIRLGALRG